MDFVSRRNMLRNQLNNGKFSRLDIIVRSCFLNSINTDDYKFYRDLYRKMQFMRTGHNNHVKGIPWTEEFLLLNMSFYKNGYLEKYPLIVNEDGHLINSSHRAALCLHHKIDNIPTLTCEDWQNHLEKSGSKTKTYFSYGLEWFEQNNFTKKEIDTIRGKKNQVFDELNLFFYAIIWPPANRFFGEILTDINSSHDVIAFKKINLGNNLRSIVKEIYEIDDIEEWKVNKKIESMFDSTESTDAMIIKINLFGTQFRSKTRFPNSTISVDAEKIKRQIREKYKSQINNYFYDNIIHMSDNYEHVDHMSEVFEKYGI